MLKKSLFLLFLVSCLNGCSKDNESYQSKIDRYEFDLAAEQTEKDFKVAETIASEVMPDVQTETFMDYPVPIHFKKYHEELGIDVSQVKYTVDPWLNQVKAELHQYENSNEQNIHGHDH